MNDHPHQSKSSAKNAKPFQWILWWQVDEKELHEQVQGYKTMKITQTARGISAILLWISVAATMAFVFLLGADQSAFIDAGIMLVLSYFVFKGYRWAFIAAMVLWTFEKIYSLYGQFSLVSETDTGASFIVPTIIWWTVYMHAFYLAFKVEQARRKHGGVSA